MRTSEHSAVRPTRQHRHGGLAILFALALAFIVGLAGCGSGSSGQTGAYGSTSGSSDTSLSSSATDSQSGSSDGKPTGKTLVVYFSATGNTERVAKRIAADTNAGIFQIVPQDPYTSDDLDWTDSSSRVNKEHNDRSLRPAINGDVANWSQYDTVYLGYPLWWQRAPHVVYTFVEGHDFTGKTVIPFCTSMSSPIEDSVTDLKSRAQGTWRNGQRFAENDDTDTIDSWVKG